MEVKIGVADSPREIVIVSEQTPDEVEALVTDALNGGNKGVLALVDEKGRKVLVQATKVTYVDIGPGTAGKVASPRTDVAHDEGAGTHSRLRPGPFGVSAGWPPRRKSALLQLGLQWDVLETAPGKRDGGVDSVVLGNGSCCVEPVASRELARTDEPDCEDARAIRIEARIVSDEIEHRVDACLGRLLDAVCHLRLAHEIGLEHQSEALAVVVDEIEECLDRGADTLLVVGGRPQGLPDPVDQDVDIVLENSTVQLEFAGEMLVEHRLADPGAVGDLVHTGGVVAPRDEHLAGRLEQLRASLVPRHARAPLRAVGVASSRGSGGDFGHACSQSAQATIVSVATSTRIIYAGYRSVSVQADSPTVEYPPFPVVR